MLPLIFFSGSMELLNLRNVLDKLILGRLDHIVDDWLVERIDNMQVVIPRRICSNLLPKRSKNPFSYE